jgi:hypothetical protein
VEEDLRALLRADLAGERPPPLGDVVAVAAGRGRRIRRQRRLTVAGAGAAVLVVAAIVAFGPGPRFAALPSALSPGAGSGSAGPGNAGLVPGAAEPAGSVSPGSVSPGSVSPGSVSPGSVPSTGAAPAAAAPARTVTVRNGTQRAEGMQKKATPAAMLRLLTTLLPPGRTSHYGVAADDDLHVQLYYDAGYGPSMLRLQVARTDTGHARGPAARMTVSYRPDDCVRDTDVVATWADGTVVRLDLASCLDSGRTDPPVRTQLSEAEAELVAGDSRWGVTMDAALVDQGARTFPRPLPVFGR